MEIWTLVKAGIRNRKGIMLGFMILTTLIVISVLTMFGVRKNYESAQDRAFEIEDRGVIYAHFAKYNLSDELIEKLEADETVDHIEIVDGLVSVNNQIGDEKYGNSYFDFKMFDTLPIYSEDCTRLIMPGTEEYKSLKLEKGEVYLPYGLKTDFNAEPGDTIEMDFFQCHKSFKIKGFVQEAYTGTAVMGYKMAFLSDEDFDEIYEFVDENIVDRDNDGWAIARGVFVYPSDKADESSDIMLRDLNLKMQFNDMATATTTRELSTHYTGLFINIILAVITGFAILLFVIFLIVAGHNISSELEIEYRNLGILKSQGFSNKKMQLVYVLQYLIVELVGIILGVIISVPCERAMSKVFFTLTAILPDKQLPIMECLIFTALLFVITAIYVAVFTRKIRKTSPVKAITNGHGDFYFDSRLNAPIKKGLMGFWLGLRQITSAPKRYISIVVVTSLLIFTIISTELMSGYIMSRNALAAMGEPFLDIEFAFNVLEPNCTVEDIENIIEKYTNIKGRQYKSHIYTSVNGENVMSIIKGYPDELSSVYKGREVKYDNEIVITEQVAKLLDIGIGDTVTVGYRWYTEEYVVVGIFQTMNDTGKAISMSLDGFSRLKSRSDEEKHNINQLGMYGVVLEDPSVGPDIVKEVKDKYGEEDLEIVYNDFESKDGFFMDTFFVAAKGSKILIYVLSIIFAIVTVAMVCAKAFIQERTDLGIYRATGFSVGRVRRSFAARFMIISLISSVLGVLLSRLFSEKLLATVFSLFGIPHIEFEFGLWFFIKPIIIFALCYFVFGYIASRKVKKISARELITE